MPDEKKAPHDILYEEKPDRRLLSYVPDDSGLRSNHDRRGSHEHGTDNFETLILSLCLIYYISFLRACFLNPSIR